MAPAAKANYKSYEAQARLVRAIVAAHPEVKWNYKEIVACFGSDLSEDALNHRWRRLRAETTIVREGRAKGLDLKNLPVSEDLPKKQGEVDKNNISKYFGQSTPDGVQFQFRGIKKDADHLRQVHAAGGDVANCLSSTIGAGGPSTYATPVKQTAVRAPKSGASTGGSRRSTAKRPVADVYIKQSNSDMEDEDDDDQAESSENWSLKDVEQTPSKRVKKEQMPQQQQQQQPRPKATTGSRRAAAQKASATIAADSQLVDDESDHEQHVSIFGNVEPFKTDASRHAAFGRNGQDLFSSADDDFARYMNVEDFMGEGDGEI